jgi:hypothetical protein
VAGETVDAVLADPRRIGLVDLAVNVLSLAIFLLAYVRAQLSEDYDELFAPRGRFPAPPDGVLTSRR